MTNAVWSVNIIIGFGLLGVVWVIYYILMLDKNEEKNSSHTDFNETSDS
jgi:hypothetical protein